MSTEIESLELTILSNSTDTAKGIDALAQSLAKLKNVTKSLGLSRVAKDIGKISDATKKVTGSNNKATTSFTDLYHKMKLGITVFKKVGESIYSCVEKSMDFTENINLFSVSMGEYAQGAYDYANQIRNAMGIDPSDWARAEGIFMTMATGFGVAGDRASVMSQNLTQLGYDLASFYNMDVETAMLKLKSGLAGELEPLRAIGYDLSQAKLEATALALGIDKSVSSMTQAEKAQLRYYAIMTQVEKSHGDMARTLDDPANQMRVFKSEINMAAREIGNMFIPALNAILPYAIAVTRVISTLASAVAGLFGYEDKGVTDTTSKVVENTDALQDNMGSAADEAKKLKSYMLGIDELNVINPNEGSSVEDTSDMFDFDLPTYDFLEELADSKVATIVDEMKEWLGITEEIDSWANLFDTKFGAIAISAGTIGGILLTWAIAEGVVSTVKMLSNLSKMGSFALGLSLVVLGITIGALAIESALTEGLNATNIGSLLLASATIIAGGALIGQTFGSVLIGAAVSAIIVGVVGLGVGLYDAIANELNVANGLTIVFATALIGLGVAALIPAVATGMGAIMGAIVGAAIVGAVWLIQNADTTVEKIGAILSGAALAVGAILAFTGINLPLGIGLMAVGAVSMGAAIAMNTDALSDEVKGVIAIITSAVSVALLAVGAVLAFSGINIPLGIALMAGGALTMATAIMPNWNGLSDNVKNTISIIMASVGGALLVLGAILAFSGVGIPLGIGLMLVGAASLGTAVALNWNAISDALRGPVGIVTAIVSGALLALGAILCFTGVGIPIGIALMLAGAGGLATVIALNWNSIKESISKVINTIAKILSGAMLVLGILLCLSGAGIGLGLALIFGALKLSNTAWGTDDNPITNFVKKMVNGIVNIINKAIDAINWIGDIRFPGLSIAGVEIIPSFNTKLWSIPKIPLMAEGGFPAEGQMFIAREAGPEMVGNIGRRTAVVNNEQIVASISGGVAEANEEQNALLREQNSLLRAILEKDSGVYLDGKNLTNSVEKYQRERGRVLITGGVI